MEEKPLSDAQLRILLENGPLLDAVSAPLSKELQARMLNLQQRAGDMYAAGEWSMADGKLYEMPQRSVPPTMQEAQATLGEAYLALEDKKAQLKGVMDAMGLTPSARRGGWLGQMAQNVAGWFR